MRQEGDDGGRVCRFQLSNLLDRVKRGRIEVDDDPVRVRRHGIGIPAECEVTLDLPCGCGDFRAEEKVVNERRNFQADSPCAIITVVMDVIFAEIEQLMEAMIGQQREKVLRIARSINPALTAEDVMNPQDFPELMRSGKYNFEDGILAGLISAQIALRARFR